MSLEKRQSSEVSRRTQVFYAKRTSYNLGTGNVQIEIDTQAEFIDFQNSRLFYELHFTTGAGDTSTTLTNWVGGMPIQNLRVKSLSGREIGREARDYNAYQKMINELKSNSDNNESYMRVLEGASKTGPDASGAYGTAATAYQVQLSHQIKSHIPSCKQYYPAHFHQGLIIEFDLPSSADAFFNYDTAIPTSVTIENLRFVCDLVRLDPSIENTMIEMMKAGQLNVDYEELLTQVNPITASTGQQAYDVVGIDGRVKSAFVYFIDDDDQSGTGTEAFGVKAQQGLASYRFKLGADYLNYQSIQCDETAVKLNRAEQVYELLKALDAHHDDAMKYQIGDSGLGGSAVDNDADNLKTNNFVLGIKADKAQAHTDTVISSRVDKQRNNMRVELTFNSSPSANVNSYTHIMLDKRVKILPGDELISVRL